MTEVTQWAKPKDSDEPFPLCIRCTYVGPEGRFTSGTYTRPCDVKYGFWRHAKTVTSRVLKMIAKAEALP